MFDETLRLAKGEIVCGRASSAALQLLARRWELGQNTSLIFGCGSERSTQCDNVTVGMLRGATDKLR
jgi:hypothetical protein